MFGLNLPILIIAGLLVAGAFGVGYMQGQANLNSGLGKKFERHLSADREIAIRREVNLWTIAGNAGRATREAVDQFEQISELSAEARAKMLEAMRKERATAAALEAQAARNIEELRNAASELAENWKRGIIPPDITCGVFDGSDCPEPAYPGTIPGGGDGVEVRDGRSVTEPGPPP